MVLRETVAAHRLIKQADQHAAHVPRRLSISEQIPLIISVSHLCSPAANLPAANSSQASSFTAAGPVSERLAVGHALRSGTFGRLGLNT